jgi:hypothetical protein
LLFVNPCVRKRESSGKRNIACASCCGIEEEADEPVLPTAHLVSEENVSMSTGTWISAIGGSWNAAADWNPVGGPQSAQTILGPYSTDTALFATGSTKPYRVTGNGIAQMVVVSGDHVTFQDFTFRNAPIGAGLVVEQGARVTIAENSAFVLINHDAFGSGPLTVNNATLNVEGRVTGLFGSVTTDGHVIISGPQASLAPMVVPALTFDATSTVTVVGGAKFTDVGDAIAGRVMVGGIGSHIDLLGTYGGIGKASQGGTLSLNQLDGAIRLAGGTLEVATVAAGAKVSGHGVISSAFSNGGMVIASGGVLALRGVATGPGKLAIEAKATLALGAATAETITFSGLDARLQLAPNIAATGFLGGFRTGDSIDIGGADITAVDMSRSGHSTVLTAFAGTTLIDSFTLGGHIPSGTIALSDDNMGGTLLTFDATRWSHGAMHEFGTGHVG